MGTMVFSGKNGTTFSIKGLMFCKNAQSTLISPAALRRAKLIIDYICTTDTFLFKSALGKTLIESPIDSKQWLWPFPQPFGHGGIRSPTTTHSFIPSSDNISIPSPSALVSKPKVPASASNALLKFPVSKYDFDWHATDLSQDEMKLLFWHCLFGHAGLCCIQKMIHLKLVIGLPEHIPKGDIKCPVCMIAKGTRTNNLMSSYWPVETLDIIACDLMGPFEIPTFDEGKYALTIRDLSSSYSEVKIMKTKDETTKILIDVITRFETATGQKVKCIWSDNGSEFEIKVLADFITSKGIRTERSLPYRHYQNGAIERYNQSMADMGQLVLTNSNLPQGFWGFAFLWANYMLNLLPNKVSGHKTPYEAFYGYKPSVDHLCVFGSRAFILIPPEKRKKLDDQAVEAHVIVYIDGSKGWMFWIPDGNHIECSAWA
jgi:hypothetical protein